MQHALFELSIDYLADHRDALPIVAGWLFEAWGHLHPGSSAAKIATSLEQALHRDVVPFQLVALLGAEVVGLATVVDHELRDSFPTRENWLGGVFVQPAHRRLGIASALAERAAVTACALGVRTLHLQTEDLTGGLYARLGWKPLETLELQGVVRLVMARELRR